jgi:hypothetical protein
VRERLGISEATAALVLLLVALITVGIVLIWGSAASWFASEAGRRGGEAQAAKMRQDISLVYWGPDGTIIITNRGQDPVRIVSAYIDETPLSLSGNWTLSAGETKRLSIGAGYDPSRQLTAVTDRNEVIVLWRARR